MSQLPNKGALPPWTPAPAGEATKVPSDMTGVSFVQLCQDLLSSPDWKTKKSWKTYFNQIRNRAFNKLVNKRGLLWLNIKGSSKSMQLLACPGSNGTEMRLAQAYNLSSYLVEQGRAERAPFDTRSGWTTSATNYLKKRNRANNDCTLQWNIFSFPSIVCSILTGRLTDHRIIDRLSHSS